MKPFIINKTPLKNSFRIRIFDTVDLFERYLRKSCCQDNKICSLFYENVSSNDTLKFKGSEYYNCLEYSKTHFPMKWPRRVIHSVFRNEMALKSLHHTKSFREFIDVIHEERKRENQDGR